MANIKSFPNNQDEYIGAEEVMRWHHGRSSGVFGADGNASVAPVVDKMAVTVSDGIGWMSNGSGNGVVWWIDEEATSGSKQELAVDIADAALPRIDRVVVSWRTTNYVALPEVIILKGEPASNPVAPALTNNNIMRQISLAAIRIPAGTTAIDASMITDERLDETVCGIVTEKVGVDTSVMQAQFATFWSKNIADFEGYMERQKAAWEAFFGSVEEDTVYPVPALDDAGKVVKVNDSGDGYVLGDAQTEIPVTTVVPADSDIWIDPYEETVEESHIKDKYNPHGVTAEQTGAISMKLLWENASPLSEFPEKVVYALLDEFQRVKIDFALSTNYANIVSAECKVGEGLMVSYIWGDTGNYAHRSATTHDYGVVFNNAAYNKTANKNDVCIPVRIYGIKGVI